MRSSTVIPLGESWQLGSSAERPRVEYARKSVSILVAASILTAALPSVAWADVALPPPPPKKATPDLPPPPSKPSSGTPDLPPPPKKKSNGDAPPKKVDPDGSSGGGNGSGSSGGGSSAKSPERTTALVLLVTGGVVTLTGTTMLLLGAGLKPSGKQGGQNTGLLVAGGVTTAVGLGVATIGLVLLLKTNNGQLPPLKSLALDHPAMRTPTWASPTLGASGGGGGFIVPWGGTF